MSSSALTVFREAVAAALEVIPEVAADDWGLLVAPVDAVEPPAYVLAWGPDPWRITDTVCTDLAQLEVLVIAHRLEPEANYPVLEAMVDAALGELAVAHLRPYQSLAPGPLEVAGVTYLAARLQLRQPVTIGGN